MHVLQQESSLSGMTYIDDIGQVNPVSLLGREIRPGVHHRK